MRRTVHQDTQLYDVDPQGMMRAQAMRVEERWETLGVDGKPYCSEATREDAIFTHLQSNGFLASQANWCVQQGGVSAIETEPLTGVRKVLRYETHSVWEVASDHEVLDEMTEQLSMPECTHPEQRRMWSGRMNADGTPWGNGHWFCGRCCETLTQ